VTYQPGIPTSEANSLPIAGPASAIVGGSFTRPADTAPYVSGDLVANSTTAGTVVPITVVAARQAAGTGSIRRVRLTTTKTGLAGTEVFRVHLFKSSPTVVNGDNGAFSVNGVTAIWLGCFDVTMAHAFSDGTKGIGGPLEGSEVTFDCAAASVNLYALVEARGAYTPASGETFTIAAEVFRD
jgi:hypothetical protein